MHAYELELYKIAKARGDSITRQLADIVSKQADRIADLETAVVFLRKSLNDTLDALSSSIEFTKAIQERSRNERGL